MGKLLGCIAAQTPNNVSRMGFLAGFEGFGYVVYNLVTLNPKR